MLFLSIAPGLCFVWGCYQTEGWLALGLLAMAGAVITSSTPVNIPIALEATPENLSPELKLRAERDRAILQRA